MSGLQNESFEIPGILDGEALHWDEAYEDTAEDVAMFWNGSRTVPFESFGGAWENNDLAQESFGDGDLSPGMFEDGHTPYEPFEFSWASPLAGPPWNHQAIREFGPESIAVGSFDSGTQDQEDFENGWSNNEDSIDEFEDQYLMVGQFDTTPQSFEDFEEEWLDNEDSISGFTDPDPTHLTAGQFDTTPENFEDFEEEWTSTLE